MGILSTIASVAAPVIGGAMQAYGQYKGANKTAASNEKIARNNEAMQREFAQHGLRWKVADAKAAGINPLAALGAQINSPAPVGVGTDYGDMGFGALGQGISRAMTAKMTKEEREIHELRKKALEVQIEGQAIDNQNAKNIGTGPPMPTPEFTGNPDTVIREGTKQVPVEVPVAKSRGVSAGTQPYYKDYIKEDGTLARIPADMINEAMESNLPLWVEHNISEANKYLRSWFSNKSKSSLLAAQPRMFKIRPKSRSKKYEYRWHFGKARWKLTRIGKEGKQVYLNPSYWDKRKVYQFNYKKAKAGR